MVEYFFHLNYTGYSKASVPFSIEILKLKDGCFTHFSSFLEVPDDHVWQVEKPEIVTPLSKDDLYQILYHEVPADGPVYVYNSVMVNDYFRSVYGESCNNFLMGGSAISLMEIFRFKNPTAKYSLPRACEFYGIDHSNHLVSLYYLKQKMT